MPRRFSTGFSGVAPSTRHCCSRPLVFCSKSTSNWPNGCVALCYIASVNTHGWCRMQTHVARAAACPYCTLNMAWHSYHHVCFVLRIHICVTGVLCGARGKCEFRKQCPVHLTKLRTAACSVSQDGKYSHGVGEVRGKRIDIKGAPTHITPTLSHIQLEVDRGVSFDEALATLQRINADPNSTDPNSADPENADTKNADRKDAKGAATDRAGSKSPEKDSPLVTREEPSVEDEDGDAIMGYTCYGRSRDVDGCWNVWYLFVLC